MKDYYQILGIGRYATSKEIKIAYRKLAIQYHPDKNESAFAERKIKEINEAYHVLGNQSKKLAYDHKLFRPIPKEHGVTKYNQGPPIEPDFKNPFKNYSADQEPVVRPPKKMSDEKRKMYENMRLVNSYFNKVSFLSFIFCCFLLLDFFLPPLKTHEIVITKENNVRSIYDFGTTGFLVQTNYNRSFKVSGKAADNYDVGEEISVISSRLAKVPLKLLSGSFVIHVNNSIYRNLAFLPLILLFTSGFGIFFRHSIEFRFNLGIVNGLILLASIWALCSPSL